MFLEFAAQLMRHARALALVGAVAVSAQHAVAAPIDYDNDRPVSPSGTDLEDLFEDELITSNADNWDVEDSQLRYSIFESTGLAGSVARIANIADGWEGEFGIFDIKDSSKTLKLFSTDDDEEGDSRFVEFFEDGSVEAGDEEGTDWVGAFGFYIKVDGEYFYSVDDMNDNDGAFALIYVGDNEMEIDLPKVKGGTWTNNEYFIAFSDGDGEKTFAEMVVAIESVQPVPEPGTFALFGAGMAIVIAMRRRRKLNS